MEHLLAGSVLLIYAVLAALFVVLPLALLWLSFRRRRRQDGRLTELGFAPTKDEALIAQLTEHLHGNAWHRPGGTRIHARQRDHRTDHVLDLHYADESTPSWWGGVVVTSSRLLLPSFKLLPRLADEPDDSPGNRILAAAVSAKAKLVPLDRYPEVAERYVLGASQPETVERLFAERGVFVWLRDVGDVLASGEADLLAIWPDYSLSVSCLCPPQRNFEDRLELAEALFDLLARGRL